MNSFYNSNDFTKLNKALKDNSDAVEKALESFFENKRTDGCLGRIMESQKYSLLGGGKRIRPFLVNEVCQMLGGKIEASMPFAVAVEMIHTYSLIHDDLPCMDDDDMRRGKLSNHKAFNESTAVLAGDALLTNAFYAAACGTLDADIVIEAIKMISDAAGDVGMIGGQITDIESEGKKITFEELLKLHSMKTGRMIELSAALGCLAAGKEKNSAEFTAICSYARKIGVVFQAVDDLLDVIGDENIVGKTLASDVQSEKTTFLSFFSIEEVREYAIKISRDAIEDIEWINGSDILKDLALFLLYRNN